MVQSLHRAPLGQHSSGYLRVRVSGPKFDNNCTLRESSLAAENQKGLTPRKAGEEGGDQTQGKAITISMESRQ